MNANSNTAQFVVFQNAEGDSAALPCNTLAEVAEIEAILRERGEEEVAVWVGEGEAAYKTHMKIFA